jgi:hypothetical protein
VNRSKGFRLLVGLAALIVLLVAGFSYLRPWVPVWGSTPQERARALPGDELVPPPLIAAWTHGITIRAEPQEVWPWIIQMGDVRGGFYSYTFIENFIAPEEYRNAERILPELQDPVPGTAMIGEILRMREIRPNGHLLAAFELPEVQMSWLWALEPAGPQRTRLVVRLRGHSQLEAPGLLMGVAAFFVNYGGFVMERRMMQGIKDRAEGRSEPPWYIGSRDRPVAGHLRSGGGRRGGLRGPPGLVEGTGRRPGRFVGPAVADLRAAVSLGPGTTAAASGRRGGLGVPLGAAAAPQVEPCKLPGSSPAPGTGALAKRSFGRKPGRRPAGLDPRHPICCRAPTAGPSAEEGPLDGCGLRAGQRNSTGARLLRRRRLRCTTRGLARTR